MISVRFRSPHRAVLWPYGPNHHHENVIAELIAIAYEIAMWAVYWPTQ
jgi:hypothetical protein